MSKKKGIQTSDNMINDEDYEYEKTEKFREANFSNYDGKAADKIIDKILLKKVNRHRGSHLQ